MSSSVVPHSIKSELKSMAALGTPLLFSQLVAACSPMLSTAMVAHLGQAALAANVLVYSAYMALSIFFICVFNAVSVLVSHQYGASAIREIIGQAFLLSVFASIMLMMILAVAPYVLNWHSQPATVVALAHAYLRSLFWTIPALMIWLVIQQCLAGMGHTKFILVSNAINIPVELLLIYGFIFGKFGLPTYGIAGVGYGLAVSWAIAIIGMMAYLTTAKRYQTLHLFAKVGTLHVTHFKELIRIGLPMGFMGFVEVSTFAIMTLWVAKFGATALAAHQIFMQYLNFFIVLVFVIAQTVAIRVGHAVGRQDIKGVHYAMYVGLAISFICGLILAFTFYFFPKIFLRLDINVYDPMMTTLVQTAKKFLAVLAAFYLVESIRLIMSYGVLRGLKDVRFAMFAAIFSFWVIGLTLAFLFGFILHFQGVGLWLGLTLGIIFGAMISIIRWRGLIKRIDLARLMNPV